MKQFLITTAMAFLALSTQALASPVQVRINGLRHNTGSILISLFGSAEAWDNEAPDDTIEVKDLKGTTALAEMQLPPGEYAFFLFHDVDGDKDLKRKAFGLPGEPYAFSNNVRIGLSKPSFQKMKFTVPYEGAVQEIQLVIP